MKWIFIIAAIGVLLWGISRIIQAINYFVETLREIPDIYATQKYNRELSTKLSGKEWELHLLKRDYTELEKRWQEVRKRKEELRHENRALKKQINNNQPIT